MTTKPKAILMDITRCIGCQSCAVACKEAHGFPVEPESQLSATAYTVVQEHDGKFVRRMCMHCAKPTCESVCPVGAIHKLPTGPVVYDRDLCMGCRYCLQACPFQAPAYEWEKLAPYVAKCDFCAERLAAGQQPACTEACPVAAAQFGDREELLAEAHRRIREKENGVQYIYGEQEAGGTSVLFLSDIPFEKLGFITTVSKDPLPTLSVTALSEAPMVATVGSALLAGLYWITQRRREVALAEAHDQSLGATPQWHS
jgi:formate dehydrogenase iron-sulfur subunit